MFTKIVTLIKQLFGIIDVKSNGKKYYFDGEFWHTGNFSIKKDGKFQPVDLSINDGEIALIVQGEGIIDAKFAIIRSKHIRSNFSIFTLYLIHNRGDLGCTKYKVLNHPNGEIKFTNPSELSISDIWIKYDGDLI